MSELKYYKLFHRASALTSPEFLSVVEFGNNDEIYDKSEADKVIAHQKYKRCLAMAWWCSAELGMLISTWESKIKYYKRWQKRWLKLAEKFKE